MLETGHETTMLWAAVAVLVLLVLRLRTLRPPPVVYLILLVPMALYRLVSPTAGALCGVAILLGIRLREKRRSAPNATLPENDSPDGDGL